MSSRVFTTARKSVKAAVVPLLVAGFTHRHCSRGLKRLRSDGPMQKSKPSSNGFNYPGSVSGNDPAYQGNGCADDHPARPSNKCNPANARINKAARDFWDDAAFDQNQICYVNLTPEGCDNACEALTKLFTPHARVCDKTLIHCEFLTTAIQLHVFAELIGTDKFDLFTQRHRIQRQLIGTDFPEPWPKPDGPFASKRGFAQNIQLDSCADFAIGDHVIFWNNWMFDGFNTAKQSDWRLENAVLPDQNTDGEELFRRYGCGPASLEYGKLKEPLSASAGYNDLVGRTVAIVDGIDAIDARRLLQKKPDEEFPHVTNQFGRWDVTDPNREPGCGARSYASGPVGLTNPESVVSLPELKDPLNSSQPGAVDRRIESAPGRSLRP